MTIQYLPRAVKDPEDHEAHAKMLLAATFAGGVIFYYFEGRGGYLRDDGRFEDENGVEIRRHCSQMDIYGYRYWVR